MYKVMMDTCSWFNLARDPELHIVLPKIEALLQAGSMRMLIPDIIKEEFERNKPTVIEAAVKHRVSALKNAMRTVSEFGDEDKKESTNQHLGKVLSKLPGFGEAVADSISRIKAIFDHQNSISIATTDAAKLKAAQRAIEKKGPLHRNKNSVADAVIIETFAEYVAQNNDANDKFFFVTSNVEDFSIPEGDKRNPHPDLANIFAGENIEYLINIGRAINRVEAESIPAVVEQYIDEWYLDDRPGVGIYQDTCQNCKVGTMMNIGAHPSRFGGGWTLWQMCNKCGFRWDTGDYWD